MVRFCVVTDCKSNDLNILSHRFPRNSTTLSLWIKSLHIDNILTHDLIKKYVVCTKHFNISDYRNLKSKHLNTTAVPTLCIKSINTNRTHQLSVNCDKLQNENDNLAPEYLNARLLYNNQAFNSDQILTKSNQAASPFITNSKDKCLQILEDNKKDDNNFDAKHCILNSEKNYFNLNYEDNNSSSEYMAYELNSEHLNEEHLNEEHLNEEHLNEEHLNEEHLNEEHLNEEHLNEEHLSEVHLNEEHLSEVHLNEEHLNEVHLNEEHLSEVHLNEEHLSEVHLNEEHLSEVHLNEEHLSEVHLNEEHLSEGHLNEEHLSEVQLNSEKLTEDLVNTEKFNESQLNEEHLNSEQFNEEHLNSEHLNEKHFNSVQLNEEHLNSEFFNDEQLNDDNVNTAVENENNNNNGLQISNNTNNSQNVIDDCILYENNIDNDDYINVQNHVNDHMEHLNNNSLEYLQLDLSSNSNYDDDNLNCVKEVLPLQIEQSCVKRKGITDDVNSIIVEAVNIDDNNLISEINCYANDCVDDETVELLHLPKHTLIERLLRLNKQNIQLEAELQAYKMQNNKMEKNLNDIKKLLNM